MQSNALGTEPLTDSVILIHCKHKRFPMRNRIYSQAYIYLEILDAS